MTENERFTWKTVHGWQTPAFLEVMNGLDKKNQQLKQENKELKKENEKLKNVLKNSYLNEICENCKHGYYYLYDNQGLEGDFECKKGHDSADCDGLKDCDDFELEY